MDHPLRQRRPLTENGRGGNLYLGAEFLRQVVCPLTPGEEIVAQTVPRTAVVLLPELPEEYPLTITLREPEQDADRPATADTIPNE